MLPPLLLLQHKHRLLLHGNPSQQAMVQDQLAGLMTQFQGTNPPAAAAGAIQQLMHRWLHGV